MKIPSDGLLRVLVAEDEPAARDLISAVFDAGGWSPPVTARNGQEALRCLEHGAFDILVTDLNMPRLCGEELVERALASQPDLTVIVLTGNASIPKAVDLMRQGVFDFLTKPFSIDDLLDSLGRAEKHVRRLSEERGLREVVGVLLKALESKDPYLTGHSERVSRYAIGLGRELGRTALEMEYLGYAALLHDIGKIGLPGEILRKEGPLDEEEHARVRLHPLVSRDILSPMTALGPCLPGVLHHHERWDGNGYPSALAREQIPYDARVIAVVDAYDAMTSHRSYRSALSVEEAMRRIERGAGTQFDPRIAATFLAHHRAIVENVAREEVTQ